MQTMHLKIQALPRGFHVITGEIQKALPKLPASGILHVFIQHTSAGITINESADPDVLKDFELYFDRIAPENMPGLTHTIEGLDDMPAHIKASLLGSSVSVPIINGQLNLGTWQGIILGEFRNRASSRHLILTIMSNE